MLMHCVVGGLSPRDIDAGLEWTGYFSPTGANRATRRDYGYPPVSFYNSMFLQNRPYVVFTSSPQSATSGA